MLDRIRQNKRPLLMLLAMSCGIIFYAPLSRVDAMTDNLIAPGLIFLMLFVTFCTVRISDLRLSPLHLLLLAFQLIATPLAYYLFLPFGEIVAQGAMICFMAPIAMAAVAIGSFLGANTVAMVAYTLLCNVVMAFVAPLYLDVFGSGECSFDQILWRVFPLLITPLAMAEFLKVVWRRGADWISDHSQISFYMWLIAMFVTLARTTDFVVATISDITLTTGFMLAFVALLACLVQYGSGRVIGHFFGEQITGGQSLGQKNTVLAVWLSQTFLFPISAIAPTAYIIWQNLVNSYQIYRHDRSRR